MRIDPSDLDWQQAQGGLRLRSASLHSSAAGFATSTSRHFLQSLDRFNTCVSPAEVISIDELLDTPMTQTNHSNRNREQAVSVAV